MHFSARAIAWHVRQEGVAFADYREPDIEVVTMLGWCGHHGSRSSKESFHTRLTLYYFRGVARTPAQASSQHRSLATLWCWSDRFLT